MVDPGRQHQRASEIFLAAADLSAADREAVLERECGGDAALRAQVELLLTHDEPETQQGFLASPVSGIAPGLPDSIGQYRILSILGEGGMGTVYEAEQQSPRRHVALKVVRPELASVRGLERFELEAAALGRLQHPGIAQIYEAGTAETSRGLQPYFAMERIRGDDLSAHSRRHDLDRNQRIELLARIADAVDHAHRQGVIHRDLKPANILVDDAGQPKILDFGVSRVVDPEGRDQTLYTAVGEVIGTLAYMSPEQTYGDPTRVDFRCDVYALGAIAFEFLSGRLPHDLRGKSLHEGIRIIVEDDPESLGQSNPGLRGDLATVVDKALEKDPDRRYLRAADLAEDLRRVIREEPILARPPTTLYQLNKFARRHRAAVVATSFTFAALVFALIVFIIKSSQAEEARTAEEVRRREATSEASKAQATVEFFKSMLFSASPTVAMGQTPTIQEVLDVAAARLADGEMSDQPEVEAALRATVGALYKMLGRYRDAKPHLERSLELTRKWQSEDHPDVVRCLENLGACLIAEDDVTGAEAAYREATEIIERLPDDAGVIVGHAEHELGELLFLLGRFEDAEAAFRLAVERRINRLGPLDPGVLPYRLKVANALLAQRKLDEADELLADVFPQVQGAYADDHPNVALGLQLIGKLRLRQGRFEEAITYLEDALERYTRLVGPRHPDIAFLLNSYTGALRGLQRWADARKTSHRALDILRAAMPDNARVLSAYLGNAAATDNFAGRFEEAAEHYDELLDQMAAAESVPLPGLLQHCCGAGFSNLQLKRVERAREIFELGYARAAREAGPESATCRGYAKQVADLFGRFELQDDVAAWQRRAGS